jgi:hypothetical protein
MLLKSSVSYHFRSDSDVAQSARGLFVLVQFLS